MNMDGACAQKYAWRVDTPPTTLSNDSSLPTSPPSLSAFQISPPSPIRLEGTWLTIVLATSLQKRLFKTKKLDPSFLPTELQQA